MDFIPRWLGKLSHIHALRMSIQGMHPALLYANDALFFIKPELQQLQILKIVLLIFGGISGLTVNLDKSELMATSTEQSTINELAAILGCKHSPFPFKYLGLPLSDSKLPKILFLPLIHNINKRMLGWAAKWLSSAGRIVLINSVLSSIPIYFMSVFNMPRWVLNEIDKSRRNFLWHGAKQNERKIHLANWSMVWRPKKIGGLGIINISTFNKAMLAKWYWQWQQKKRRLWKDLFEVMYCTQNADNVNNSHFFKKHLKGVQQFCHSFSERVQGQGDTVQLWEQDWGIGIPKYKFQILYTYTIQKSATLQEFIQTPDIASLFRSTLSMQATHQLHELECHRQCYVQQRQNRGITNTGRDEAIWKKTVDGNFTVRSAYYTMEDGPRITSTVHVIWKPNVPPRYKVFTWLLIHNKILTANNLRKRGYNIPGICYMCRMQDETVNHLFNQCQVSGLIHDEIMQGIEGYITGENNI